jgi:hypothetical protein
MTIGEFLSLLRNKRDRARIKTRTKSVLIEKFDGDPQPGDQPVEIIEIAYDATEHVKSRAVYTDPAEIQQRLTRRSEKGS